MLDEQGFAHGAVFCSSDARAHGVIVDVPCRGIATSDEIAVIGYGDQEFTAHTWSALTSVRGDRAALGRLAADGLLGRLAGTDSVKPVNDVGFEIVVRASG